MEAIFDSSLVFKKESKPMKGTEVTFGFKVPHMNRIS